MAERRDFAAGLLECQMARGSAALAPAAMNGLAPRPLAGRDLIHCPPGSNRPVLSQQGVGIIARKLIAMLDEKPVVALAAVSCPSLHAHQHPPAPQLFASDNELELAFAECGAGVGGFLFGHPVAAIPEHHCAAAVFAFRDRAFEIPVVERMVLDLHRQSLVAGIAGRTFGDSPGFEYPVELEPQVIVQTGRSVLLDDEARILGAFDRSLSAWLQGLFEIAFGLVCGKLLLCHRENPSVCMRTWTAP
jgi:hypothetical protein